MQQTQLPRYIKIKVNQSITAKIPVVFVVNLIDDKIKYITTLN